MDKQIVHQHLHPLCMLWAKEATIAKEERGEITLSLKGVDPKVLYVAARPKKFRSFIIAKKFMSLWIENPHVYEKEPPEIGIVYSTMKRGVDGIAHAIPMTLSHPILEEELCWKFKLGFPKEKLAVGLYKDIVLFIDWLPSKHCPGPIQMTFPSMYSKQDVK